MPRAWTLCYARTSPCWTLRLVIIWGGQCPPLQLAAREGHIGVAEVLLKLAAEKKVDITTCDTADNTVLVPLELALTHLHFDLADVLRRYGARVDLMSGAPKRTGGHRFAVRDSPLALDYLLQHGLDPNTIDAEGETMLMAACGATPASLAAIQLVLSRRDHININYENKVDGHTALSKALAAGNIEAVALLILKGSADPTVGRKTKEWLSNPEHKADAVRIERLLAYCPW